MAITPQNYADPVVTINTSLGSIYVELYQSNAPITVNNFLTYAYSNFYSNTIFHRVVSGFVDQGGGYTAQLQQKATLAPIVLESQNGLSNLRGTIAMARTSDPNSATSQFYFNAVNNTFLDYASASSPGYAVFGNVIQGLNVVDLINAVPVNSSSIPLTPVVIQSVTTAMYYQGNRSDYTISMAGGQLAVSAKSASSGSSLLPSASQLSKIEILQFADQAVNPAADTVSAVITSFQGGSLTAPSDIFDSAANVQTNLDSLQTLAAGGKLISIGLTDSGTPSLTVTASQFTNDSTVLADLTGSYRLVVTGVLAANTPTLAANSQISALAVSDSASHVSGNLDQLQTLASAGKLASVTLTDSGIPNLSMSSTQAVNDASALHDVVGYFSVTQTASGNNLTLAGVSNALGNTVAFNGTASQFTITPAGDGVGFSVATAGSTNHLSGFQAVQFNDVTLIMAQTPGTTSVTSGNITELYGAVFGRLPDVAGLAYYQNKLAAIPTLPLTIFAQWFLASSEYTTNSTHNYTQNTAGDTQFITDAYNNLLHRPPENGAAAWYEANVIAPFLVGLTPGTAAYTSAETLAHAYVITDFSASAEFLADVTVTAQNPASAQHWLMLI